jgi:hypothetical protein
VFRHGVRIRYLLVVVAVIGQWPWLLVLLGLIVGRASWWCWLVVVMVYCSCCGNDRNDVMVVLWLLYCS